MNATHTMHSTAVRAGLDILVEVKTLEGEIINGPVAATRHDRGVEVKVEGDDRWHSLGHRGGIGVRPNG